MIEPDPTYRQSATVRSAAAIRQQFNLLQNVQMSLFGWEFFTELARDMRPGTAGLGLTECPYMMLAAPHGVERLRSAHARQIAAGAEVTLLDPAQLSVYAPWLRTDGVGVAALGRSREGWLDPEATLRALRLSAEAFGTTYVPASATALDLGTGEGTVTLSDGRVIQSRWIINAAGPKSGQVARLGGISSPIESRQRSAFVFRSASPPRDFPNLVDPTWDNRGVYVRPYGTDFMAITSPDVDDDPDTDQLVVDARLFDAVIRPALANRVRGFEHVELLDAWSGLFEMNTFDTNGIVGPHPGLESFIWASGFSGHGFMHAPALGRALAELLIDGRYRAIDLTPFSFGRITRGTPLDDVHISEHRTSGAGL